MKELLSRCERMFAWFLAGFLILFQLMWIASPATVFAASPSIVISQLQVAGSSAADEFIELYNPTSAPVDISNWAMNYRGGAASSFSKVNIASGQIIPAHSYYLLANASGSFAGQAHQTYNNSTLSLSAVGGTVFLTTNQTPLTTGSETSIIDKLAYGTGTLFPESTAFVPAPALNMSIARPIVGGATTDTDNNASDFTVVAPSTPHGSTFAPSPLAIPTLTLSPDTGKITATWGEVPTATGYGINITSAGSVFPLPDEVVAATTFSKTFTGLANGTLYTIRLHALRSGNASDYTTKTATPTAPIIVAPLPIQASIAYFALNSDTPATSFGLSDVRAEVTFTPNSVLASENPILTLTRVNTPPVVLPLAFDAVKNVWKTQSNFTVTKSTGNQDGNVAAGLTDNNHAFSIVAGNNFTVDTLVNKPVIAPASMCSPDQDSFTATVDSDVTNVYIYRAASADLANLLAVAQPTQGKVGPVFLGNNMVGNFYVVAQDLLGNRSDVVTATNDILAPDQPSLQLEAKDKVLRATWNTVTDTDQYILHWQKVGTSTTEERILTSSLTSYDIPVTNDTEYLVSLAARDKACNTSSFAQVKGTAHVVTALTSGPKGGVSNILSAMRESAILDSVKQQTVRAAISKDGEPVKISPFTIEEDQDQNGIKDSEEDKNGNGIKDGEENQQNAEKQDEGQNQSTKVKDRSRLILGIAILLIIAGAAIAAYSWYQGDRTPPSGPSSDKEEAPAAAPKETTETKKSNTTRGSSKGTKKRKTRW